MGWNEQLDLDECVKRGKINAFHKWLVTELVSATVVCREPSGALGTVWCVAAGCVAVVHIKKTLRRVGSVRGRSQSGLVGCKTRKRIMMGLCYTSNPGETGPSVLKM